MYMSRLSETFLDEKMLLSSADDDIEFALELIDAFKVSTEESLRKFEDAVAEARWSEAALHSHSMKGSAKTLGLNEFGDFCSGLEAWCRHPEGAARPIAAVTLQISHNNAVAALSDFARRKATCAVN